VSRAEFAPTISFSMAPLRPPMNIATASELHVPRGPGSLIAEQRQAAPIRRRGEQVEPRFQELRKRRRVVLYAWPHNGCSMRHEDFRGSRPFGAAGMKIGAALRDQYDLTEPPPQSLVDLLNQLDARIDRERTKARLYAAVDDAVTAVIDVAKK
jgi:hypothetical protein